MSRFGKVEGDVSGGATVSPVRAWAETWLGRSLVTLHMSDLPPHGYAEEDYKVAEQDGCVGVSSDELPCGLPMHKMRLRQKTGTSVKVKNVANIAMTVARVAEYLDRRSQ